MTALAELLPLVAAFGLSAMPLRAVCIIAYSEQEHTPATVSGCVLFYAIAFSKILFNSLPRVFFFSKNP